MSTSHVEKSDNHSNLPEERSMVDFSVSIEK